MSERGAIFSSHIKFVVRTANKSMVVSGTTFDANSKKISNVLTPTEDTDAATKLYVDQRIRLGTTVSSSSDDITIAPGDSVGGVTYTEGKTYQMYVVWTIAGNEYSSDMMTITNGDTTILRQEHVPADDNDEIIPYTLMLTATSDTVTISAIDRVSVRLLQLD